MKDIAEKLDKLTCKVSQLQAKLNSLEALSTSPKEPPRMPRLKDVHAEKGYYANFPTSEKDDPCFMKKFLALTRGLDEESCHQIVQIIQRLRCLKNSKDELLPEFTHDEMRQLEFMEEHFQPEILRLEEGCYFYDGYLLPTG